VYKFIGRKSMLFPGPAGSPGAASKGSVEAELLARSREPRCIGHNGIRLYAIVFGCFSRDFSIISVRQRRNRLDKESSIYVTLTDQPLSPEEVSDIAELRLALISLAVKPAHRHLAPADFDHAYELAKRMTRTNSANQPARMRTR
jgi:hypothetical protein